MCVSLGQHIPTGVKLWIVPSSHQGLLRSGMVCLLEVFPWRKCSNKQAFGDVYMLLDSLLKLHSRSQQALIYYCLVHFTRLLYFLT